MGELWERKVRVREERKYDSKLRGGKVGWKEVRVRGQTYTPAPHLPIPLHRTSSEVTKYVNIQIS